jgi:hypothetical protein
MERKVRQLSNTVVEAAAISTALPVTLTIGKTVLQPIEPTVGNKGPRSQPYFVVSADELDDTPVMELFAAEGDEYARQGQVVQQRQRLRLYQYGSQGRHRRAWTSIDFFAHFSAIQMDGYKTLKQASLSALKSFKGP